MAVPIIIGYSEFVLKLFRKRISIAIKKAETPKTYLHALSGKTGHLKRQNVK